MFAIKYVKCILCHCELFFRFSPYILYNLGQIPEYIIIEVQHKHLFQQNK